MKSSANKVKLDDDQVFLSDVKASNLVAFLFKAGITIPVNYWLIDSFQSNLKLFWWFGLMLGIVLSVAVVFLLVFKNAEISKTVPVSVTLTHNPFFISYETKLDELRNKFVKIFTKAQESGFPLEFEQGMLIYKISLYTEILCSLLYIVIFSLTFALVLKLSIITGSVSLISGTAIALYALNLITTINSVQKTIQVSDVMPEIIKKLAGNK